MRNIFAHIEWNVLVQIALSAPVSRAMRSCISSAALLVNVIARML